MNIIKKYLTFFAAITTLLVAAVTFTPAAHAVDVLGGACNSGASSAVCDNKSEGASREDAATRIKTIINLVLGLLGIVAVIVIIIAGFRYIASAGDEGGIKQAKNTIIYAVIGLIVAIMAFAIVNFVIFGVTGK